MTMKILVVDDDSIQREVLKGFLANQGYSTLTAVDGEQALQVFQREPVHLVLLDYQMPGYKGDEVLARIKAINPFARVILITAYGDVNTAVTVLKLGADEFLEKPVDLPVLLSKIQKIEREIAVDEDVAAVMETVEEGPLPLKIVSESPGMKEILSLARRIAETPWPVLIQGETGTGKELIARLIHLLSPRRDDPFIELNCAAIPENLFESELFGHEKGAFTGALNRRRGRFELADKGTLFFDEIGEMPLLLQPKLLRALEEKKISRVGGEREIHLDVRVVLATNRDLKRLIEENQFRDDLYYRIKVFEVYIPPLRERREDIPALVDLFLHRHSSGSVRFSTATMDTLLKYPYPGNVRELEHIIQRTITLARGEIIHPVDLPEEIRHYQATTRGTLVERLDALERELILSALEKRNWVQTQAAELLGIDERVLRYKMKKHVISKEDS
jgi:two-component system response regulator AtoC